MSPEKEAKRVFANDITGLAAITKIRFRLSLCYTFYTSKQTKKIKNLTESFVSGTIRRGRSPHWFALISAPLPVPV